MTRCPITPSRALTLLLLLSSMPLAAQTLQYAGNLQRAPSVAYTRGLYGNAASEMIQRFDASELCGYGVESAYPGVHVVRGIIVALHDFGGTGSRLVDVTLYAE